MMTTPWRKTDLSMSPASYQKADTDRVPLGIGAGEPITAAVAEIIRLDTLAVVTGVIEGFTVQADGAIVLVSGLTRGVTYELDVTFEDADGSSWTRTLVIQCVA